MTGAGGFVASHMVDLLLEKGEEVVGTYRWFEDLERAEHFKNKITMVPMDLIDMGSCLRCVRDHKPEYFFHLAAQSFVPDSFIYPAMTIMTNTVGTLNLLEAVRLTRDEDKSYDPVIHVCSCYDSETKVVTRRGVLGYNDIRDNDQVLSIDPSTREVSYRNIKRVISQDYEGLMVEMKTRSVDLKITPNHQVLFSYSPKAKLQFKEAIRINQDMDRCYMPIGKYNHNSGIGNVIISGKSYPAEDIFYLLGLYIGDGYSGTQIRTQKNKTGLFRDDYLRLARDSSGRFVSGKFGIQTQSRSHSYRIFLAIPQEDKSRQKAIKCLNRLGIVPRLYDDTIYFTSKAFVEFFDTIGHSALIKKIPDWVFDYDYKYLQKLYEGLIDSDGYYHQRGERFSTSSKSVMESFLQLCLLLGKPATVSLRFNHNPIIKGRVIKDKSNYLFSITDGHPIPVRSKRIQSVWYKGKVWCLEIEGTHNFAVYRNGKTTYSGNSSEVYGQVDEGEIPITESQPFRPQNPYGASKVGADMIAYVYWRCYGLKIIRTRMFTHTGYGRTMESAEVSFARQIALIEKGKQEPVIKVGNLDSIRTIADVRDAVRAYYLLVRKCKYGEVYNIGGDKVISIREMLNYLISLSPMKTKIKVEVDPKKLRFSDVTLQIPSSQKFKSETGWKPEISFEKTMSDLLEFWRDKVGRRK